MKLFSSFRSPHIVHKDIYLEILTRLDVKSLTTCKLVSKAWYVFLSHPSFARLYLKRRPFITGFFYRTSKNYPEKLHYVSINAEEEEAIVDPPSCLGFLDYPVLLCNSCNGLLHWSCSQEQDRHFISNPLTNKFIAFKWPVRPDESFASGIAFEPSVSDHFQVVVLMEQSQVNLKSLTFSSDTVQWDEGEETLVLDTQNEPFCRNRGVFLNGFLFWELKSKAQLLAYNVENQSVHLIQLPFTIDLAIKLGFQEPGCLGESGQRLHYCRLMGTVLCVWVATQNSSINPNWAQEHLVNLSQVICEKPSIKPNGSQALAFLDDCEVVLLCAEGKVMSYRLDAGTVHEVCNVRRNGHSSHYVHPSVFIPFVHSLAMSSFHSSEPRVNSALGKVWNMKMAPKYLLFLRRCLQNSLAVNTRLKARKLRRSDVCPRCKESAEDVSHLLLDCKFSRLVWRGCRLGFDFSVGEQISFPLWWVRWVDEAPQPEMMIYAVCVMWEVWKGRNSLVFEAAPFVPSVVVHRVEASYQEASFYQNASIFNGLENCWYSLKGNRGNE